MAFRGERPQWTGCVFLGPYVWHIHTEGAICVSETSGDAKENTHRQLPYGTVLYKRTTAVELGRACGLRLSSVCSAAMALLRLLTEPRFPGHEVGVGSSVV